MKLFGLCFSIIGLTLTSSLWAQSDSTKSIIDKGINQYRIQQAKHLLNTYDYVGALEIYEELQANDELNPTLIYRIGEINYKLNNFELAEINLGKAISLDNKIREEIGTLYAMALHRVGKIDEAMKELGMVKELVKEKEAAEIDRMYKGLTFAKKALNNPYQVNVENMGRDINSSFDDYGPSISADEKTLIFTSRRPDNKGGDVDVDGKYFEDIFISNWNAAENKWDKAEAIKGRLNTEYHDACLSISPDGRTIYVYKNFGENGSGEIYQSNLSSSGKWGGPKALDKNINTSYFESSASITADGEKMYFLSERTGGMGMADIWVADRISKSEWAKPINLGEVINTPLDERMVFVHPEGNILFFASEGHIENSIGGYDIYMSEYKNDAWQAPVNLGAPINSVGDDVNFILSMDAKTAYYSGFKAPTFGERDIYKLDVLEHELIKKVREQYVTIDGEIVDALEKQQLKVKAIVTIKDLESGKVVKVFPVKTKTYSTKVERGKKYSIEVKASGFKIPVEKLDATVKDVEIIKMNFEMVK